MKLSDSDAHELLPRAAGSSFYAAMRVLRPPQRKAMFAIYGFCRAVDDIADGPGDRNTKLGELSRWRAQIDALFDGVREPAIQRLIDPVRQFDLRRQDFMSVIDGMEMDVVAEIDAPELATLDLYCDRVACAVGRICVRVFGMSEPSGDRLAHHLGRALQLTNILRDLDEDAQQKRLYLPRETLRAAGIAVTEPMAVLMHSRLPEACAKVADSARGHFAEATEVMSAEPLRTVRAPLLMAKIYQHVLDQLIARGWSAPRHRIHVPKSILVWNVLRYGLL